MSDLKLVFQKKDGDKSFAEVSPEEYESVHVMRDDLDALSGKVPEAVPSVADTSSGMPVAGNPFLDETVVPENPDTLSNRVVPPSERRGDVSDVLLSGARPSRVEDGTERSGHKPSVFALVGIVVGLGALAFVAWFFFFGQSAYRAAEPAISPSQSVPVTQAPPAEPTQESQPYSTQYPNYLQIDTESPTATPDGIASVLERTEAQVAAMAPSSPVEFLVRDANNNPIAFSRFAHLAGLTVPDDFLSNLDESFSIYLMPEGSTMRRAISIRVADSDKLDLAIKDDEPSLPAVFGALLYGKDVSVPATVEFRDGAFGSLPTRYAIVDPESGTSFDHVIFGGRLIIATSKTMFQTVLGLSVGNQTENQP